MFPFISPVPTCSWSSSSWVRHLGFAFSVFTAIYHGPVANLWHNLMEAKRSMDCVVDLQVNHTTGLWEVSTSPLRRVMEELVRSGETLNAEMQNVSHAFMELNDQVASNEGYDLRQDKGKGTKRARSTQELYERKTKHRCASEQDGQGLAARRAGGCQPGGAAPGPCASTMDGVLASRSGSAQAAEDSCLPGVIQNSLECCEGQFCGCALHRPPQE
ncbi:E3 ubiquitin-protein ligase DCST1-like [Neopelma chrysocephalum]|uniref:E3 ubiquitin-protein ligase DCST1-like n=1 Tax=Neopelma chrysocephalum TaxID=114329 RepID=UPI000FCD3EB7|nr:E3 ubiquitin-protein ligase DCST1-like [Neopelma chrysocephalum]